MSFSASTCLSYTGSLTLSPTLTVYSNPISPSNFGTYVTTVSSSDITGGNCPYVFVVPDGTTTIRLYDIDNFCYTDIPVSDNNLCVTCDIDFNTPIVTSIGKISVGDITGNCDASISNYKISWYKSTNPLTPAFTSGKGTMFQPYDQVHPLTGTSEVPVISGSYTPQLDYIELNGIKFSRSGDTGTVLADLDCLPPSIVVEALNCVNGDGSSDLPQYEHKFAYSATTGGGLPQPLYSTFELSAGTNYFVWKFKGFTVPDKIKLTLSGASYGVPIVIDYWEVGSSITNSLGPYSIPRRVNTNGYLSRIVPLTSFTIVNGDNIIMEVTPSTATTQTSWTFYCSCLDTVDCEYCYPPTATTVSGNTSYQYPIDLSSLVVNSGACGVNFTHTIDMSSCPYSAYTASTFYKYYGFARGLSTDTATLTTGILFYNQLNCTITNVYGVANPTCVNLGAGNTITYEKSNGLFKITSNQLSTINTYYYQPYLTNIVPKISFPNDNTNPNFYRMFKVWFPNSTGTTPCGDGTIAQLLYIHQSSVVTTGTTGSDYYIQFTMPTITSGITYSDCDIACNTWMNHIIGNTNVYSTAFNYTGTTTVGSTYLNAIGDFVAFTGQTTTVTKRASSRGDDFRDTSNYTFPYSGDPLTIIPSLSSETCSNFSDYLPDLSSPYFAVYQQRLLWNYEFEIFDPTNLENFRIYSIRTLKNGAPASPIERTIIYEYSGGTVTYIDNDYFV